MFSLSDVDVELLKGKLTQEDGYVYYGLLGTPKFQYDGSVLLEGKGSSAHPFPTVSFLKSLQGQARYLLNLYESKIEEISRDDIRVDESIESLAKEGFTIIKVPISGLSNKISENEYGISCKGDVRFLRSTYELCHVFEYMMDIHSLDEYSLKDKYSKEDSLRNIEFINQVKCVEEHTFERSLNQSTVVYPGTQEKLWNCPPYSVPDIELKEDITGGYYATSVTIKNGKNEKTKFDIMDDGSILLQVENMDVKYKLETDKAEFIPYQKEDKEASISPKM